MRQRCKHFLQKQDCRTGVKGAGLADKCQTGIIFGEDGVGAVEREDRKVRFFHMSDLHIGLRLYNYDLKAEQRDMLAQVIAAARKYEPEGVVIAGDIYDKSVPSAEAVELFSDFMTELSLAVPDSRIMVISGNHDSGERLDCFRHILKRQHVHMAGLPPKTPEEYLEKITMEDEYGRVNFYLLPFVRPSMVKELWRGDWKQDARAVSIAEAEGAVEADSRKEFGAFSYHETIRRLIARESIDEGERNVLVSHQFYLPSGKTAEEIDRAESEIRTVGNIDQVGAELLSPFDYCALGHIHKPMKAGGDRFQYSGTPLTYSVSEIGQEKGFLMVELKEKGDAPIITGMPITPLHQVIKVEGSPAKVLAQGCEDYVLAVLTEVEEGDVIDLADRMKLAFPRLLEIVSKARYEADYGDELEEGWKLLDPVEMFQELFPDMDEEEKEILRDVVNTVKENDQ